jgi:general secretion pathway protein K
MALVLTLLAVSFLVAVTVQLATSVNWQMQAAANQGGVVQLDAMLFSGLNLARASLLADQEENDYDSTFDSWGEFDTEAIGSMFSGTLTISVTDLSGLLQVNALVMSAGDRQKWQQENQGGRRQRGKKKTDPEKLQRELWKRFLLLDRFGLEDEEKVAALVDSLVDWLDADDDERENGAEQGFYTSKDPPYAAANGSILFPEELLLVKEWDKKILYGSGKTGDKEETGIIDYLTNGGQAGKININTAPALVLQALHPEMTEELAADLIDFRSDKDNEELLSRPDWYHQVSGFPGDINFDKDLITISSSWFRVTVTAEVNGLQRVGTGIINRQENQEQVLLYWKVE